MEINEEKLMRDGFTVAIFLFYLQFSPATVESLHCS